MLRLTDRAISEIKALCEKRLQVRGKVSIPAIMWLDAALNNNNLKSSVAIGFYDEEQRGDLGKDIVEIDGLECVLAIPGEYEYIFKDKTLDFHEKSFVLLEN
jgi:hypothetical protein